MPRRFYGFNDLDTVKNHISQIKTLSDLQQLEFDILLSGTNLTQFREGNRGCYAVDCCAGDTPYRHLFLTADAMQRLGEIRPEEADSYTVLDDNPVIRFTTQSTTSRIKSVQKTTEPRKNDTVRASSTKSLC